ncbi:ATP-binding protein [Actinokineospora diospyrosa]|uniref:Sensor-like histidine kinase SenX3 n=1 Tax=Actinokineospora diospyrosa TaxID=103728 RepID=A0ABT1IN84_9PSEU|nr:ATP-binding protein [Actinokineospora diospyrosa]MCP2274136.1 PAS domain-containing protein [Actinokineospora diospyrosa]
MTVAASLARTAGFAALFVAATVAGRLTVLDSASLSLVWPAAGVAVLWFCAQRDSPVMWVDVLGLALITVLVNSATGATPAQAAVFVVSNLLQVWVFVTLVVRWRPDMWTLGPGGGLNGLRDLWVMLVSAFTAATTGAAVGPTALWLITGHYSGITTAVWMARNVAGVLLVGIIGLCAARAVAARRADAVNNRRADGTSGWRVVEYVAVSVCSVIGYLIAFARDESLPVASMLIALTVWAAARLSTTYVALHTGVVATIAVVFTLHGQGPFAVVPAHAGRALLVQLFVIIVAVVGLALALGRDERDLLLAELAEEKEQAALRAQLKRAIIDSMADGVSVVDSTGRVSLRNPAAVHLLGGKTSPDDMAAAGAHYGVFNLDGSPLSAEELPYLRVLAGEAVGDMDLLIRNDGVPEGRIVQVKATALPEPDGGRSAVLVYHDVTAERRQRDELASFAGVVAHDLLNPLSAVDGWSDAANEALRQAGTDPAVEQARSALVRVLRASSRMRGLINDLLAYTTARDASIAPVPIDLTAVVADTAAARTDAAVAAAEPVPEFSHDALDPVQADRVLLRQLLDNLIGNAIKYTAPGVVPEITISTTRRAAVVTMEIADNGIGIPAGQHERIFGSFHRAHVDTGYTGTGLGLAICKRIVERHGGTITATDNPTGGSRFIITLPAAIDVDYAPPVPRASDASRVAGR